MCRELIRRRTPSRASATSYSDGEVEAGEQLIEHEENESVRRFVLRRRTYVAANTGFRQLQPGSNPGSLFTPEYYPSRQNHFNP